MFRFAKKALLNRSDQGADDQRKEGWERTEDKHLEPLPAGLTLSASRQADNAKKKKAKSGAGFQERELLPAPRGSCLQLQASRRTGTTRTFPQPLRVSFACWTLKMTRPLIFHQRMQVELATVSKLVFLKA